MKKRVVRLLIGLVLLCWASVIRADSALVYERAGDTLMLNNDHYMLALNAQNGAIIAILDKATGKTISQGNADDNLWVAQFDKGDPAGANAATMLSAWDNAASTLTLTYTGTVDVTVKIIVSDSPSVIMSAELTNHTENNISDFDFPANLTVDPAQVQDALLPMMPGALVGSGFFTGGRSYIGEYPGIMFADYVALRSNEGKLAVYSHRGAILQPTLIGFERAGDDASLTHNYQTWIAAGNAWTAPTVTLNIGQDYPDTIAGYRADNGIDAYPSLTDKLADKAETYFAAPMYKLDVQVLKLKFAALQTDVIDKIKFPGIVHLVAFGLQGHDKNYPTFVPPDKKWGTTEDFAALVSDIHARGSLAVPYTNFSWWDNDGPVLLKLPEGSKITEFIDIKDSHGLPGFESYGPNSGFVMNLHNAFVTDKITEQHRALKDDVGMDAIFEDQWGARAAPYDFNPARPDTLDPATSYYEGVLDHYRNHADSVLMTEVGVDVLAEQGVAFMGTNYLWDMLGYRGATADQTTYYPMAAMLLRDKVLLYQHNLAAETWTDNKDMLRWNLAQGYGLSIAFFDKNLPGLNMDNPWLNLVGIFQKVALANYADELVTGYESVSAGVTKTTFDTYTVYANDNADAPYSIDGYTLPGGGVVTRANDGSVTAGVFTAFHGQALSDGEHYLVETRGADAIDIYQPVGAATDLAIPVDWPSVIVTAYSYDDSVIGTVDATVADGVATFNYDPVLNGATVGYYRITAGQ